MRILTVILAAYICSACSGGDLDFCSLLSLEEVRELDPDVISSEMGIRGKTAPTQYCVYSNSSDEEVFLLSIGNPTKNSPYRILQTYVPLMEGENNVVLISGIGKSAAALFSDDYESDKFRLLIANGDNWSVSIRAKGIHDENTSKFSVLKEMANKALSRF